MNQRTVKCAHTMELERVLSNGSENTSGPDLAAMMSLSTWRSGVLGPKRAIQEMTPGERRTRHTRNRSDARTQGRSVRSASAHTEREHPIEYYEPKWI